MLNKKRFKTDSHVEFTETLFLQKGIHLCKILERLHDKGFIHKGLCPSLVTSASNPDDLVLNKCNFFFEKGILKDAAGKISAPGRSLPPPITVQELLNVISPEQTGRFDWIQDRRSDLYSLGCIFYYWSTGNFPFYAEDEIGYFHAHIAKDPLPPHRLNPGISMGLSQIMLKLLNKSPEHRYQSAMGVAKDFELLLQMNPSTSESFIPGRFDIPFLFTIHKKIYGRETELGCLNRKFEQVLQGHFSSCFVAGSSGVGKTSLIEAFVREIFKNQTKEIKPVCTFGKFDRLERNRPYHAFIQAFEHLADQILSKTEKELVTWKKCLKKGLSGDGAIIANLIPGLRRFADLDQLPEETDLNKAREKIRSGFIKFFDSLCSLNNPIIMVIDDLQWADKATLAVLQALLEHKIPWLFFIGAYRNDQVDDDGLVAQLSTQNGENHLIRLGPITKKQISVLIREGNRIERSDLETLSDIVYEKTRGIPFFVSTFLTGLFRDKLLVFNTELFTWKFDEHSIRSLTVTDNVAESLIRQILNLPEHLKTLLKIVSCTHQSFDLDLLLKTVDLKKNELLEGLAFLESRNFLIREKKGWRFSHDRIKDQIYDGIARERQKAYHLRLGRSLIGDRPSDTQVYDILLQLNQCLDYIEDEKEQILVAGLNLRAGLAAFKNVALESAFFYACSGIELIPAGGFETCPELSVNLHFLAGKTGFYVEQTTSANRLLDRVCSHAPTLIDRVRACEQKMSNLFLGQHMMPAWRIGLEAMKMLGMKLPAKVRPLTVAREFIKTRWYLRRKPPETLEYLPKMNDPEKLMAIRILARMCEISYLSTHEYIFILVLKILNITLKHGENEMSGYAYALYGAALCERFGRYDEGYRFGKLAVKVNDQEYMNKTKSRTFLLFGGMINPWKNELTSDFPYLLEAHRSGVKNGNDLLFAAFAMNQYLSQLMISGQSLGEIVKQFENQIEFFSTTNPLADNTIFNINYQAILTVMGKTDDPRVLIGNFFNETIDTEPMLQKQDANLRVFYMMKAIISFFFYEWDTTVEMTKQGLRLLNNSIGVLMWPYFAYLMDLSILSQYHDLSKSEQRKGLGTVKKHLRKMKQISFHSPKNFSGMYELILAEVYSAKGDFNRAVKAYEAAFKNALDNNLLHLAAVAGEFTARFFLRQRNTIVASAYMNKAYALFKKWEAHAKLRHLEMLYPDLLSVSAADSPMPENRVGGILGKPMVEPDLVSMLKASQVISRRMDIRKLMDKLMTVILENTGARRAFLVLLKNDTVSVEAIAMSNLQRQSIKLPAKPETCKDLPNCIIQYVLRSKQPLILDDASENGMFAADPCIQKIKAKSILCLPMIHDGQLAGAFYLDNNKVADVFTRERATLLKMVADILTNAWSRKMAQEKLIHYQDELRALSSRISSSEEKERRSIAQGLHDQIGQTLVISKIKIEQLGQLKDLATAQDRIEEIVDTMSHAIEQTRNLTFDLSPPELYKFGLESALEALCERKSKLYGFPIEFKDDENTKPINESSRILLYQVVRELLFNTAKHARATKAAIHVFMAEDRIKIQVEDNGVGFNLEQIDTKEREERGFGLFSIKERMYHSGFEFSIFSSPGKGVRAVLSAPLELS